LSDPSRPNSTPPLSDLWQLPAVALSLILFGVGLYLAAPGDQSAKYAEAMDEVNRQLWANPSSVHRFGQAVRQRVDLARASVAGLINSKPGELIFTSGGTFSELLDDVSTPESADATPITDDVGAALIKSTIITTTVKKDQGCQLVSVSER